MNLRAIVNVATGPFVKGQKRLMRSFNLETIVKWRDTLPTYSPSHSEVPYAFKAWALKAAAVRYPVLLYLDACMVPGLRPLSDLWERIERDGYLLMNNGWSNYEWTADSAYPDLFAKEFGDGPVNIDQARTLNRLIPHLVGGVIGLDLRTAVGKAFLDEYLRLAQTKAFRGPWTNGPELFGNTRQGPCGPSDVRGHRHDQTAASVIAWRLGTKLTDCPEFFAYKGGETDQTCVVADGAY